MEQITSYQGENIDKNIEELQYLRETTFKIKKEVAKVLVGQQEYVDLILAALLSGGHILLEGVPGIAKTLLAKLLARTIEVDFSRIQFTPDLMPTDVIGTTIFNLKDANFNFRKGPIFSNFILIDEINRSPAKTQASLFEVMEERQVSVDGTTYQMSFPFMVIATQNPIEQEGTYRLPEAQLDRFLFRIKMDYPNFENEKLILRKFEQDFTNRQVLEVKGVMKAEDLKKCQEIVETIYIKEELLDYIAKIVFNTRNNGDLYLGASPRASLAILKSAKAMAALNGRNFVIPDDIRWVTPSVLNHRIIASPEKEMEGITTDDIINNIIKGIEVPR
ncbi:MAG: MoxR family ATPase [Bacteroidetes bacterium]|nr:MoxR family ATPase [Bacteroidota bacterium]MBK7505327.1 MoxR family ATPase [Bacteroidota bacterium]